MSKKQILALLLLLAVMSTAWADPISENQARVIADNFNQLAADLNNDKIVDITDVSLMIRIVLGIK